MQLEMADAEFIIQETQESCQKARVLGMLFAFSNSVTLLHHLLNKTSITVYTVNVFIMYQSFENGVKYQRHIKAYTVGHNSVNLLNYCLCFFFEMFEYMHGLQLLFGIHIYPQW